MDENAHPTKRSPESPTPEVDQLLRLLEIQAAERRNRQGAMPKGLQGVSFRWGSIIVILVFALGSVGVMEWIISQLPRPVGPNAAMVAPAPAVQAGAPVSPAASAAPGRIGRPAPMTGASGMPKD